MTAPREVSATATRSGVGGATPGVGGATPPVDVVKRQTPERDELAALDDATLATALSRMHVIRKFEEVAEASYMRGLVHGTMHLSIGQEASAVGSVGDW